MLITEEGGVQLCDFGVAGIVETKVDKRSTVIGTPHWMAPELFTANPSYGKEVDIWAFGAMVYEIATGLPPNVANGIIPYERLGSHLRNNVPRLEGGDYSDNLRDLVACCLEELSSARPTIEEVQKHPYIYNTSSRYPASSLSHLVRAFKMWEDRGGSRKSLFMLGGVQGRSSEGSYATPDDEWNFSTTATFDQEVSREVTPQDVYEAYGTSVEFESMFTDETSRPSKPQAPKSRRRPPPEALSRMPAQPLEKIFDPNTLSNYEENSRTHYGRQMSQSSTSDLPLRDDSAQNSIRDTMIDLGGHDSDTGLSNFPDLDTIKAGRHIRNESDSEYVPTTPDFSRPAHSDPAEPNDNRRTRDWKFPSMVPPASADPELSRFPSTFELQRPAITPGSGARPALVHHPTEPLGAFSGLSISAQPPADRMSLIDLDMGMIDMDMGTADFTPDLVRPSTASSEVGSETSESMTGNPFELEKHASLYQPQAAFNPREPSIYVTGDTSEQLGAQSGNILKDLAEMSDFSASDMEGHTNGENGYGQGSFSDSDYKSMPPPPRPITRSRIQDQPQNSMDLPSFTFDRFPSFPDPPSAQVLTGQVKGQPVKDELERMLSSTIGQLEAFRDTFSSPQLTAGHRTNGPSRRDRNGERRLSGSKSAGSKSSGSG